MGKTLTKKHLQEQLDSIIESNTIMQAAALMVGFDIKSETDKVLENVDKRVRINLHQRGRIHTLESLLEDLEL